MQYAAGDLDPPVVVLPQGTVESGQFPQLHLAQVVLILWCLDALLQDVTDLWTQIQLSTQTHTLEK